MTISAAPPAASRRKTAAPSPRSCSWSRRLIAWALACTLLTAGLATRHAWLGAGCGIALVGLVLWPQLRARRAGAAALWLLAAATLGLLATTGQPRGWLDGLSLLVNAALGGLFAATLKRGRQPLIAGAIEVIEGGARLATPGVAGYARNLTRAWACLFGAQALAIALILAWRVPHGLFDALGLGAPVALAAPAWMAYVHVGSGLVAAVFMLAEYAFRRWHLRHVPHASLPRFLFQLARHWPQVLRRSGVVKGAAR